MGMPYGFSVGGTRFYIHPVTLGKMLYIQRRIEGMEVNAKELSRDASIEALRLAKEKRDDCLSIIYVMTCRTRDEVLLDHELRKKRISKLSKLSDADIAAMVVMALTMDRTSEFMKRYGIDKEQKRMSAVTRAKKKDKGSITFGGRSQFGALLDYACERYGWTKEYVVWGIDYPTLRMMLADKISSVYVSDEEWKRIPLWAKSGEDEERINGDDAKAVREAIKSQKWD